MDTRVDLLNLIGEENGLVGSQALFDLGLEPLTEPEPSGLEALKIEAEKTSLELGTEACSPLLQSQLLSGVVADELPSQGSTITTSSQSVYDEGLGLLELLTSGSGQTLLTSAEAGFKFPDGQDLIVNVDTSSPILSPMSPEDVETILSSGPASPESLVTEESFESLMSSFMSSSADNNTSAVFQEDGDNVIPEDLAILRQMIQQEDNFDPSSSDSDSQCYTVNKTRPTPYQRGGDSRRSKSKKDKVTASSSFGPVDKQLERKLRKKQQNKDAATRYRQKKKQEQDHVNHEVALLEGRNHKLKDQVDQMTREIQYLKNLIEEVYKARSQQQQKAKSK